MAIRSKAELKQAILDLEQKKKLSQEAMVEQFHLTKESLKPSNLVKNTLKDVAGSSDFRKNLLKVGLGIGAALVTKKFFAGPSLGKKALGIAMNLGLANMIAEPIKEKGLALVKEKGIQLLKKLAGSSHNGKAKIIH